ncbi:SirB1 family protein [Elioraea rosea]|uniref:SirB1 family protein n=1 Tax=Elioraea rosea TaxID=2492390 RepID=UPI0011825E9A|nr:transglutaminase-like domain-containing protein [Elioraea rosea]
MSAEAVRAEARAALERFGGLADGEIDIAEAALAFARIDLPEADVAPAASHLADLARAGATLSAATGAEERALALRGLLVSGHGYTGDTATYDDPANANLLRVVERRRGLPVALGVVWLHTAAAAGFDAWGIDFPAHFLLGIGGEGEAVAVDVFDAGLIREEDELVAMFARIAGPAAVLGPAQLRPMTRREVLLRQQNNLRIRRAAAGDLAGAIAAAEDMLRLAPDAAPLWQELAVLAERAGHTRTAIAAWERLRDLGSAEALEALARLRRRLN